MNSLRVVLDTNCLVSALLFAKGRLSRLRVGWQGKLFIPVVCKETTEELIRVLSYPKFRLESDDVNALLAEFLPYVETFALSRPVEMIDGLTDVTDAIFIHLARQANTDWLISGDVHLLALKKNFGSVKIISPADFLRIFDTGKQ